MKLRQMLCLTTLVECGFNVSRAAEALHATQPAVGKQLRQFEEELGVDLFQRRGSKIVGLSRSGEDILRWCRVALQAAGNIRNIAQDAAQQGRGSITIGTTHTHARYIIVDAIRAFSQAYPQVRLHLLQGTPEGVMQMVRDGRADLGITTRAESLADGVAAIPFLEVPKLLLVPPGHPLLAKATLTLEDLAHYPLISSNVERPMGASIQGVFRSAGVDASFRVEALDADVMKGYVAAGLGIAIIPAVAFDPEQDRRLQVRALDGLFGPTTSCVLLRRGTYLSRAAYDFLARLSPRLARETVDAHLVDGDRGV
jgi:LysR family transcriptional regulator, cys regulon transcriptional activator